MYLQPANVKREANAYAAACWATKKRDETSRDESCGLVNGQMALNGPTKHWGVSVLLFVCVASRKVRFRVCVIFFLKKK